MREALKKTIVISERAEAEHKTALRIPVPRFSHKIGTRESGPDFGPDQTELLGAEDRMQKPVKKSESQGEIIADIAVQITGKRDVSPKKSLA